MATDHRPCHLGVTEMALVRIGEVRGPSSQAKPVSEAPIFQKDSRYDQRNATGCTVKQRTKHLQEHNELAKQKKNVRSN